MRLSERLKSINEAAIAKYQDEIDNGSLVGFELVVRVDKKSQMPYDVLVDLKRKLEVNGVHVDA